MFLANYSDGLTDVDLDDMVEHVQEERQDRAASSPCARRSPSISPRSTRTARSREFRTIRSTPTSGSTAATSSSGQEIFDYMREGEELVLEPFSRLIDDNQLMAYKHEGFWRSMDTLRDRQVLEDMVEQRRDALAQGQN